MWDFLKKIVGLAEKAFSWVEKVKNTISWAKSKFPGLFEFIEDIYNELKPKVEDPNNSLTGEDAKSILITRVQTEFTNSPTSIPKKVIVMLLEIIHAGNSLSEVRSYDRENLKQHALKTLKGLQNKYGDR